MTFKNLPRPRDGAPVPDDAVDALLGEVDHGRAEPGLRGVSEDAAVVDSVEGGEEPLELVRGERGGRRAGVGRGEGDRPGAVAAESANEVVVGDANAWEEGNICE